MSVEIVESNAEGRGGLRVDDHLPVEIVAEVVETQVSVGVLRAEGQVEGHVAAPGPGVLQQVEVAQLHIRCKEILSGREDAEIVGKDVGGAVAAAAQGTQRHPVGRRPADVGAGCEEPAVEGIVLQIHAAYEREAVTGREGVFGKSRNGILTAAEVFPGIMVRRQRILILSVHLVEIVELPGGSKFNLVGLVDFVLVDQIGKSGILSGVILFHAEEGIEFVMVEIRHQCDVGGVLLVEWHTDLEVAVDAAVLDVGAPDPVPYVDGVVFGGVHLAAEAVVVDKAAAEADLHTARGVIEPAAGEVQLQVFRLVAEAVLVVVHLRGGAAHVGHIDYAPFFVELDGRGDVALEHGVGAAVELDEERRLVGGLAVLHVDLAGDGFQAVDYGRGTFGDLDALQPLSGDERHPEGSGDAAHHGPVLVEHLGVGAGEAEEFDLPGAGHGIGVADRDAGGVFETLCQGAAGHFAQAGGRDDFGLDALHLGQGGLHGGDFRFIEVVLTAQIEFGFSRAGLYHDGVAGVAHVSGYQRGTVGQIEGELAVGIGLDQTGLFHVIDLGEGKRFGLSVGILIEDASEQRLCKGRECGQAQGNNNEYSFHEVSVWWMGYVHEIPVQAGNDVSLKPTRQKGGEGMVALWAAGCR